MTDEIDLIIDLGARVAALETVIKTVIGLQLASRVKDPSDLTKVADLARTLSARLQAAADLQLASLDPAIKPHSTEMYRVMRETVARCFDQPADQMAEMAKIALEMMEPATDTKQ
ncbi:MAG TPA: hypothetical protein VN814_13470 [Caulobacteraceae bacterium]|nr:hypothetical protein [Caulobacteraceae bacterium]